ncbi:MAG: hypothetical protein ACOC56_06640 [Atribacterota bacterium]
MAIECRECGFPNQEDSTGIKAFCPDCLKWTDKNGEEFKWEAKNLKNL